MISLTACGSARPAHALNHLERGETRHVPVDDDQMRRPLRHGGDGRGAVGDGAHDETRFAQSLAQRLDCGNIPIDDQYLFIGFGGKHAPRH